MTTHRLLNNFQVCVPESQRDDYLAVTPHVVTHPDDVVGLTPKLNWMLAHLIDDEGMVFLDDDLSYLRRNFTETHEPERRDITAPAEIEAVLRESFEMAVEFGVFFFGWETGPQALRYYGGHKPFSLTGYIPGHAKGFRTGHGLTYDERIVAKDDYDVSALNAFRHRCCFRDNRYAFAQRDTFTGAGGLSHFRNSETERRDCQILREKYGDLFVFDRRAGTRQRDYAGAKKVTMNLPY